MNLPNWIVTDVKASKNYELHLSFANGKKVFSTFFQNFKSLYIND